MPGAEDFRRHAGISFRQLDTWSRVGYLKPNPRRKGEGSGVPRTWPMEELVVAQRMKRLVDAGFHVAKAAELARAGPGEHQLSPYVVVTLHP